MDRRGSLSELVQELEQQKLRKQDFVVGSDNLTMEGGNLIIHNPNSKPSLTKLLRDTGIAVDDNGKVILDCLGVCHGNIADKMGIPKRYYDKMRDGHLDLLDANVGHWLNESTSKYFVRTFIDKEEKHGYARALLSDRFFVMDNYDILLTCLDAVKESGFKLNIESCDISERRMYVRFVAPEIEIQAPELLRNYKVPNGKGKGGTGNGIVTGFVISNSEIGQGQFSITPRAMVLACSNGMMNTRDAMSKTHLGTKMTENTAIDWSDETKKKNVELICSQVKDAINTFCSEDYLGNWIQRLQEQGEKKLEYATDCIQNVATHLSLSEEKERDILNYFIEGGDTTGFGVAQALTFYAHESEDADEQYELEAAAVNVLSDIDKFDKPTKKKGVQTQAKLN